MITITYTTEERENVKSFIGREYSKNTGVTEEELNGMSDTELFKLYEEAYRYTEWGL